MKSTSKLTEENSAWTEAVQKEPSTLTSNILYYGSTDVVPVHVCQGLVKRVLSDPFVSWEVTTPAACVGKLIPPVLQRSHSNHDSVRKKALLQAML